MSFGGVDISMIEYHCNALISIHSVLPLRATPRSGVRFESASHVGRPALLRALVQVHGLDYQAARRHSAACFEARPDAICEMMQAARPGQRRPDAWATKGILDG